MAAPAAKVDLEHNPHHNRGAVKVNDFNKDQRCGCHDPAAVEAAGETGPPDQLLSDRRPGRGFEIHS